MTAKYCGLCAAKYLCVLIIRVGLSRLTFTNQVSLKSRVAQYSRLRNGRLVSYPGTQTLPLPSNEKRGGKKEMKVAGYCKESGAELIRSGLRD